MSNIVTLPCLTKLDIPADRVLESAAGRLESAILIGVDKDGELYFAASFAKASEALWLIETIKSRLIAGDYVMDYHWN